MQKQLIIFLTSLLYLFCLVMTWVPLAIFQGYGLMLLWSWFIAPLGIQEISIMQAIGITLIINFLTSHLGDVSSKKDIILTTVYWFLGQLLIVFIGFIIKTFFMV